MSVLPLLALPLSAPLLDPAALAVATIWQEARGESEAGKLAVAEVIRDRTLRRYQSDGTLIDTLFRPYQFSGWNTDDPSRVRTLKMFTNPDILKTFQSVIDCAVAWNRAVTEETRTAKGALLYHAASMKKYPGWARRTTEVARIGGHIFYVDQNWREPK